MDPITALLLVFVVNLKERSKYKPVAYDDSDSVDEIAVAFVSIEVLLQS